jgi:hypothetical protein
MMYQTSLGSATLGTPKDTAEALAKQAIDSGRVSKAEVELYCRKKGYTRAAFGTSWDDKCLHYQWINKVGPIFGKRPGTVSKAVTSPFFIPAAIGAAGLLLYLVLRN